MNSQKDLLKKYFKNTKLAIIKMKGALLTSHLKY